MARSRRSSIIEAHNVFEKYHRHDLDMLESLTEKDEESTEFGKSTASVTSSMKSNLSRQATPHGDFPMFHRGMFLSCFIVYVRLFVSLALSLSLSQRVCIANVVVSF